ncbi:hypothetical protein PV458_37400 [Streptomyces sp. MN03-5084-2B]|nr:hypothetical protein [Streptomyces sp. MN03-5084-2B]
MSRTAPLIALSDVDYPLLCRFQAGGRVAGAREVLRYRRGAVPVKLPLDRLTPELAGPGPVVLALPGAGAVQVTGLGYALLAGTPRFLAGALPDGVDDARARFARVARRLARPELVAVAERFPPLARIVLLPDDAAPGSGVAEQLAVMAAFVRGELSGSEFGRRWHDARRRAKECDERTGDTVGYALGEVFFLLEDYPIDPLLREPGDLTDEELTDGVRAALEVVRR